MQVTLADATIGQERMLELSIAAAEGLLNVDLRSAAAADGDRAAEATGMSDSAGGSLSRRQLLQAGAGAALAAYGLVGLHGRALGGQVGGRARSSSRRSTATC